MEKNEKVKKNQNDFWRNLKLTVSYDGTAYHGFQRQTNAIAIQQILEDKLAKVFGHKLTIYGAGRTDTGVHAYGQVINFFTAGSIPTDKIPIAARGILPADIVVRTATDVPSTFHARRSASSKKYIYRVYQDNTADPLLRNYAWHVARPLARERMDEALSYIVGTHDFSAFQSAGGAIRSPIRTIMSAECRMENNIFEFSFWGNGFLYHMVRNIVGTVVEIGFGKRQASEIPAILAGRDRKAAGVTAPPQGLYLQEVIYK